MLVLDLIEHRARLCQLRFIFLGALLPLGRALLRLSEAVARSGGGAVTAGGLIFLVLETPLQRSVLALQYFAAIANAPEVLEFGLVVLADEM